MFTRYKGQAYVGHKPAGVKSFLLGWLVMAILASACGPAPAPLPAATPGRTLAAIETPGQLPTASSTPTVAKLEPSAPASNALPTEAVVNPESSTPTVQPTPSPTSIEPTVQPTPPPTPIESPVLPPPPVPLALPPRTPEQQAVALADALASQEDRLAAWLGVYDALSIPVIGQMGIPVGSTGDDPIGLPFWQVWYASTLDLPGRGIRLSEAGRLMTAGLEGLDAGDVGTVLLDDLRSAAQSNDPQVRLFGLFVRERVLRGPSHLDLLDEATSPISATIDLPTVQLLGWVIIRGTFIQAAQRLSERPASGAMASSVPFERSRSPFVAAPVLRTAGLQAGEGLTGFAAFSASPTLQQQAAQPTCAAMFGDEDVTYWVNWVANKLGGGLQLPGMQNGLPGLTQLIQKQLGTPESVIKKTSDRLGWASAFTAALTLAMQLASVDVSAYEDPDPLERTKRTSDGKQTTIHWALLMDPGKLPDGNNGAACFLSFLSNMFGISFSFPTEGRIPGAEMNFYGGEGFPDLVLFGDYKQLRQDTDANGEASLLILGRAQQKDLPDSAQPVEKEFSVLVRAQPEAVNGNTIANIFFGGLTFGASPGGASLISALIDILKTFTWDLGEHVFRLTDWKAPGFRYYFSFQGTDIKEGIICSFEKPFAINATLNYPGVQGTYRYDFTPTSPTAGTVAVSGSFTAAGEKITMQGDGTYEIQAPDTEAPAISVLLKKLDTKGSKGRGSMIPAAPGAGSELIFELEPLQTNECGG